MSLSQQVPVVLPQTSHQSAEGLHPWCVHVVTSTTLTALHWDFVRIRSSYGFAAFPLAALILMMKAVTLLRMSIMPSLSAQAMPVPVSFFQTFSEP